MKKDMYGRTKGEPCTVCGGTEYPHGHSAPQEKEWKGTCGSPIYDKDKNMIAVCGVINCQTHKSRQDNWKEENWEKTFGQQIGYLFPPVIESNMIIIVKEYISSLLSSQAHALKEQMKACVPEAKKELKVIYIEGTDTPAPDKSVLFKENVGFNDCREQTLSALNKL